MLASILLLGTLILIHELGHYLAARAAGIRVQEFSVGVGPTLLSRVVKGTRYSLRWLPFGGYVLMHHPDLDTDADLLYAPVDSPDLGLQDTTPQTDTTSAKKRRRESVSVLDASPARRAAVLLSGSVMNLLFAIAVMVSLVSTESVLVSTTVAGFREESLSAQSGLQEGDAILRIDGKRIYVSNSIITQIVGAKTDTVPVLVRRDGARVLLPAVRFPMSGSIYVPDFFCYRQVKTPWTVVREGYFICLTMIRDVYTALVGMVAGKVPISELSGPVGTSQVISEVAREGFAPLMQVGAFISVNLAVFNLLPFPALDGGKLLFLALERIRGRPARPELEGFLNMIGFALLILLLVLVTYRDLLRLFGVGI